ncbi:hypothetical protein ElyMa_001891400 [Elysia marginata]|uniref:Uncharacterized protein n=1 Tax=Elysia marginata TaxID=1093978 RepID=A0AAV4ER40_9GAST|nr:hypothetical protein ElyMa_001891400 [Elysia marginata]
MWPEVMSLRMTSEFTRAPAIIVYDWRVSQHKEKTKKEKKKKEKTKKEKKKKKKNRGSKLNNPLPKRLSHQPTMKEHQFGKFLKLISDSFISSTRHSKLSILCESVAPSVCTEPPRRLHRVYRADPSPQPDDPALGVAALHIGSPCFNGGPFLRPAYSSTTTQRGEEKALEELILFIEISDAND